MKALHMIAFVLLVVGGLNWGLTALGFNVVDKVLGAWPTVEKVVYILVGLSALWEAIMHTKQCKYCASKPAMMGQPGM